MKQILDFIAANPSATIPDLRAQGFKKLNGEPYEVTTLNAQLSRMQKALGLRAPGNVERAFRSRQHGATGEQIVADRLAARGWLVCWPRVNAPVIDLVAVKAERVLQVQCKAINEGHDVPLKQANVHPHVLYVVVDRSANDRCYVIPGEDIARKPIYYRSPCEVAGRIRFKTLAAYLEAWPE